MQCCYKRIRILRFSVSFGSPGPQSLGPLFTPTCKQPPLDNICLPIGILTLLKRIHKGYSKRSLPSMIQKVLFGITASLSCNWCLTVDCFSDKGAPYYEATVNSITVLMIRTKICPDIHYFQQAQ